MDSTDCYKIEYLRFMLRELSARANNRVNFSCNGSQFRTRTLTVVVLHRPFPLVKVQFDTCNEVKGTVVADVGNRGID
jgi:hypothetical protein